MQELAPENYVKEPNMTLYQLIYFFFSNFAFYYVTDFLGFFCVSIVIVAFFCQHLSTRDAGMVRWPKERGMGPQSK